MTSSSQLSVETHAAIYSVALIVVFKLVGTLFSNLPTIISECVYHSFIVFLTGICIRDKNQSAHGIAQFFGLNSHDALTRMLYHNSWSASLVMLELLHQAMQLATGTATPSWLIIDDVILPKHRSIKTSFIGWDYDYVNKKNIRCLRLVVVAWSNGTICIPVAFALYYKKDHPAVLSKQQRFRTKNQLAQLLVYQIMKKGLPFDYLVFDSWYASAENLSFFQKLNITFVTAIKSNRKLRMPFNPMDNKPKRRGKYQRWYQLTCTELTAQAPYVRDYHYYLSVAARARTYLVLVEDVDFLLRLVCIKNYATNNAFKAIHTNADKRAKDPNKYLVTNDVNLTIPNIINYYRNRWTIEVMFRDCKQHLALGKCQGHKSVDAQLRHTAMVFLAFTLLELMKSTGHNGSAINTTIGDIKRYLQHQQLIYVNGQYHVVDISQSPLNWDQVNQFINLIDIKNITSRETQLVFNYKF
jgi:SRSO17 transposase